MSFQDDDVQALRQELRSVNDRLETIAHALALAGDSAQRLTDLRHAIEALAAGWEAEAAEAERRAQPENAATVDDQVEARRRAARARNRAAELRALLVGGPG